MSDPCLFLGAILKRRVSGCDMRDIENISDIILCSMRSYERNQIGLADEDVRSDRSANRGPGRWP